MLFFLLRDTADENDQRLFRIRHQLFAPLRIIFRIRTVGVKALQIQPGRNHVNPLLNSIALQHFLGLLGWSDQFRARLTIQLA